MTKKELYRKLGSYSAVARELNISRQAVYASLTGYVSPSNRIPARRTEQARRYRKTEKGKQAILRSINKYRKNHPERLLAWLEARKKIKLLPCIRCGEPKSHRHHPDIRKPLEVIFLCAKHHKDVHCKL